MILEKIVSHCYVIVYQIEKYSIKNSITNNSDCEHKEFWNNKDFNEYAECVCIYVAKLVCLKMCLYKLKYAHLNCTIKFYNWYGYANMTKITKW